VEGFSRPYVRAAQGALLSQHYDSRSGVFEATIDVDLSAGTSELFLPTRLYGPQAEISVGSATFSRDGQILIVEACGAGKLELRVGPSRTSFGGKADER
jgi:hypothetical protein